MKALNTYLTFSGKAREAMTFYAKCLGADLSLMTFGEAEAPCPEGAKDQIMHARLTKGSVVLMASDTMPGQEVVMGDNFSIAVTCENITEIEKTFTALSHKVTMPLQETFFAKRFGMVIDQFGIQWMLTLDK